MKALDRRIYSAAIHPSDHKLLTAFGDVDGNLAIWTPATDKKSSKGYTGNTSENGIDLCVYRPHKQAITKIQFHPIHHTKLISSSFDGHIREFDLSSGEMKEMYEYVDGDNYGLTSFSLRKEDSSIYYISCESGAVHIFDSRSASDSAQRIQIHQKKINTGTCFNLLFKYYSYGPSADYCFL